MSARAGESADPARARRLGLVALVAGAVCIGFAPLWVRWSETGPVATAFGRLLTALPFLAWWAARERRLPAPSPVRPGPPASAGWVWAAGLCFALDLGAWHVSIQLTSVANATLLANLAPLVVALGAWWFLRERPGRRFFLGLAVAVGGVALLSGAQLQVHPTRWRGDLLGLVTAVFYGGYQLCVARLRRDRRPGEVLLLSTLVSVPCLGLLSHLLREDLWPDTLAGWGAWLGLGLTAQVAGQGLITYGFAHLPARHSSLTLLIQPLIAAGAAWVFLGEGMAPVQAVGAVALLAGLWIARTRAAVPKPSGSPGSAPAP